MNFFFALVTDLLSYLRSAFFSLKFLDVQLTIPSAAPQSHFNISLRTPQSHVMEEPEDHLNISVTTASTRQLQATKANQQDKGTAKRSNMHILEVPQEIRSLIWQAIKNDADNDQYELGRKPKNKYIGFIFSCRKIYHESHTEWLRFDHPWSRVDQLLHFNLRQCANGIQCLVLDIPQTASQLHVLHLAHFLGSVGDLRELRLYFHGRDLDDQEIYTDGCGNRIIRARTSLYPMNQRWEQFRSLWGKLKYLRNLEVLVISNANLQINHETIMYRKRNLQYLRVTTDPCSVPLQSTGQPDPATMLCPPPLKVLEISANASLQSTFVAITCVGHLEHLSWTIPAHRHHSLIPRWLHHTAHLISVLRGEGVRLHTLRMCLGDCDFWEDDPSFQTVLDSFTQNFRSMQKLKRFELHAKIGGKEFGVDILQTLPPSLEQLFVSDTVISARQLRTLANRKLLTTQHKQSARTVQPRSHTFNDFRQQLEADGVRSQQSSKPLNSPLEGRLPQNEEPWIIQTLRDGAYSYDDDFATGCLHETGTFGCNVTALIKRRCERGQMCRQKYTIVVGEDLARDDFIDLDSSALVHINYEYNAPRMTDDKENVALKLLLINGRLHDRCRNVDATGSTPGSHIRPPLIELPVNECPPRAQDRCIFETASSSGYQYYATMLFQHVTDVETQHPRDLKSIADEWASSQISKDRSYFGNEMEAQVLFDLETPARVEDLPAPYRPVIEEVWDSSQCRWACPDAVLPTLAERGAERQF